MIEVGRSEQIIIEIGQACEVRTTLTKPAKEEIEVYIVAIGGSTRMWHTLVQYLQGTNLNSKMRCQQCNA